MHLVRKVLAAGLVSQELRGNLASQVLQDPLVLGDRPDQPAQEDQTVLLEKLAPLAGVDHLEILELRV